LAPPVRRTVVLITLVSALASGASASASLTPLRRHFGDVTIPRFTHGQIRIPAGHADGRVRVIVTLRRPQACAWARVGNQRSIVAPRTALPVSAATPSP
jgi:hypothetical protein